MGKVTFVEAGGREHVVDIAPRLSLMEGAVKNNVPGIVAQCGGACACATCHVYVDEAWRSIVEPPQSLEHDMLELVAHIGPGSRLSCRIEMSEELDGLVLHIPESQGE